MSSLLIQIVFVLFVTAIPLSIVVYVNQNSKGSGLLSLTSLSPMTILPNASFLDFIDVALNRTLDIDPQLYNYNPTTQDITLRKSGNYLFTFNLVPDVLNVGFLAMFVIVNMYDPVTNKSAMYFRKSVFTPSSNTYSVYWKETMVANVESGTYRISLIFSTINDPTLRTLNRPVERFSVKFLS